MRLILYMGLGQLIWRSVGLVLCLSEGGESCFFPTIKPATQATSSHRHLHSSSHLEPPSICRRPCLLSGILRLRSLPQTLPKKTTTTRTRTTTTSRLNPPRLTTDLPKNQTTTLRTHQAIPSKRSQPVKKQKKQPQNPQRTTMQPRHAKDKRDSKHYKPEL